MSYRVQRVGSEMQKVLSQIIRELKDPRITEMVSVTEVQVAKDLTTAKVFVSIYGDNNYIQSTFEGLVASSGYIRKELARVFKDMRIVPDVRFVIDNSMEYAQTINKKLDEINIPIDNDGEKNGN
ncbi:MAG: 30S ribosome-binding factor RbfA [Firmicutes bacterium]|nr:30S ribosome-binding factor RbfA [Bacillota bacterium]MCL1954208.1 30S ribosome-binding factor RbfA [Bacillota bacterium]